MANYKAALKNLEDSSLAFHLKSFQFHPNGPLLQVFSGWHQTPALKHFRGSAEWSHIYQNCIFLDEDRKYPEADLYKTEIRSTLSTKEYTIFFLVKNLFV